MLPKGPSEIQPEFGSGGVKGYGTMLVVGPTFIYDRTTPAPCILICSAEDK